MVAKKFARRNFPRNDDNSDNNNEGHSGMHLGTTDHRARRQNTETVEGREGKARGGCLSRLPAGQKVVRAP